MMASSSSVTSPQAKIGTTGALLLFHLLVATTLGGAPVALPGCPDTCGSISIPYPFGVGYGCFYREGFNLTCDEAHQPPKLFLDHNVQVLDISLPDATVRISSEILKSSSLEFNSSWSVPMASGPLTVSTAHNWFVSFGCNILAHLIPYDTLGSYEYTSICAAMCLGDQHMVSDSSCSSSHRCRTSIAWGRPSYGIVVRHLEAPIPTSNRCKDRAVFIVDQEWFSRNQNLMVANFCKEYAGLTGSLPVVLEWSLDLIVDNRLFTLNKSSDWRCLSLNSFSYDVNDYDRRRCHCSQGYEGNPYFADGCQDINECLQPDAYPCHGTCINEPGTYQCLPKKSISGHPGLIIIIAISASFGLLFSLLGVANISNKLKQRRAKKLRKKFFTKNYGLLLRHSTSSNKDIAETVKIFSLEELEQATNTFDQNRILGGGGHGTVYKGILSNQRIVAIKKSKFSIQREINQFVNEIVILSQINHRNVVKLFGCCLETEVPLLVYEFISNGTLYDHLHMQREHPLSWKDRLRIAVETAKAIAYLHSAASISVFHRDIKSENILLTDNLTSKISDFGASRSIAIDETAILTTIQGTYGYLDPEYYYTSRLTEKSDVYSFGVILAELLTRMRPVLSSQSSVNTSLTAHFISLLRDNRLSDILDPQIVEEGRVEEAELVARLTEACLSFKGEERPTMRQVEMRLEEVQVSKVHLNSQVARDTKVSRNVLRYQPCKRGKRSEGTRVYSLEKEFLASSEFPR